MQAECEAHRLKGLKIGFVPTMGFLHDGHASLIRHARRECNYVVVSIFVNPTQFGPSEDYAAYPRDLQRDLKVCEKEHANAVFTPDAEDMYSSSFCTSVTVDRLSTGLCGAKRPGHFRGVCTVVAKLFNIVKPHRAYFGQKDFQQLRVIQQMAQDLNFDVEVVVCPTVRERDGLALSSRNSYLSDEERGQAPVLYKSLQLARATVDEGERIAAVIRQKIEENIALLAPLAKIDYVEVVDADSLEPVFQLKGRVLVALAVFIGKTRLIDNEVLEVA